MYLLTQLFLYEQNATQGQSLISVFSVYCVNHFYEEYESLILMSGQTVQGYFMPRGEEILFTVHSYLHFFFFV